MHDVCFAWLGVFGVSQALFFDALSLLSGKGPQILFVIVWMRPDAAGRLCSGVDEELVACFWVVRTDPAFGKRASFVFHRAADGGWDGIVVALAGYLKVARLAVGSRGAAGLIAAAAAVVVDGCLI